MSALGDNINVHRFLEGTSPRTFVLRTTQQITLSDSILYSIQFRSYVVVDFVADLQCLSMVIVGIAVIFSHLKGVNVSLARVLSARLYVTGTFFRSD